MEDKEVGELWRKAKLPVVIQLIRKLVEERARNNAVAYYHVHGPDDDAIKSCVKSALRDFGIDPTTFSDADQ